MIETKSLQLIPCELTYFEALLSNKHELEQLLKISIPDRWTDFPEAIPYAYASLKADPASRDWATYLFIHTHDKVLIGWGGFKGQADASGTVELGYEIIPEYRNRGLATEAAKGLLEYAFSHSHVRQVDAHTLPEQNISTKILEKLGMKLIETVHDPDSGDVWHWRLSR